MSQNDKSEETILLIAKQIAEWAKNDPDLIICIDSPSGVGKTTIAKELGARFGFEVIHMDKFLFPSSERVGRLLKIKNINDLIEVYKNHWFDREKVTQNITDAVSKKGVLIMEGLFPLNYIDKSKSKTIRLIPSKEVLTEIRERKFVSYYKNDEKKRPRVSLLYKACDFAYDDYAREYQADFVVKLL